MLFDGGRDLFEEWSRFTNDVDVREGVEGSRRAVDDGKSASGSFGDDW